MVKGLDIMKRFHGNPILKPISIHPWESRRVFNAAASIIEGRVHILYRAMGNDGISRLGYASSSDGYLIEERLSIPVFEPVINAERMGCEDPRLIILADKCVMTYTALSEHNHQLVFQVALTSITVEDFVRKLWKWENRRLPFSGIRNKDAVIFPRKINRKYVMLHRIEPDICMAYSDDLERWYDLKAIIRPRTKNWDCLKVGAAGPPIELNEGWLVIYHGVNFEKIYSLGVALLDRDNPDIVLYRSEKPILTPVEDYERFGKVPNVVFSCGNILMDNQLIVYYGGADSVVCVATYDLCELTAKK